MDQIIRGLGLAQTAAPTSVVVTGNVQSGGGGEASRYKCPPAALPPSGGRSGLSDAEGSGEAGNPGCRCLAADHTLRS